MTILPADYSSSTTTDRRVAAIGAATAEVALSKHVSAQAGYRLQVFHAPDFQVSSTAFPLPTPVAASTLFSNEPSLGITYHSLSQIDSTHNVQGHPTVTHLLPPTSSRQKGLRCRCSGIGRLHHRSGTETSFSRRVSAEPDPSNHRCRHGPPASGELGFGRCGGATDRPSSDRVARAASHHGRRAICGGLCHIPSNVQASARLLSELRLLAHDRPLLLLAARRDIRVQLANQPPGAHVRGQFVVHRADSVLRSISPCSKSWAPGPWPSPPSTRARTCQPDPTPSHLQALAASVSTIVSRAASASARSSGVCLCTTPIPMTAYSPKLQTVISEPALSLTYTFGKHPAN